jgi:hypothetical protein
MTMTMQRQRPEHLAEDFENVYADYQLTPPWRLFRRLRLLGEALAVLMAYVVELDAVRVRQLNAGRRCEGR